jgi:hypothetical protein
MGNYGRIKAKRQFNHQLVDKQYLTIVSDVTEHTLASKRLEWAPAIPNNWYLVIKSGSS